jgi:o-succinylbenzoate synthase
MKNIELTYSPYTIKLKQPFETAGGIIKERRGFIIELSGDTGFNGMGDAAPFPEFGSESFDEAEEALEMIELKTKIDIDDIKKSLRYNLRNYEAFPALRHGLEQAILNLICSEKKFTLNELLNLELKKTIRVNAACSFMNTDETAIKVKEFIARGYRTIKLKTGREDFNNDLAVLKAVRDAAGNDLKIRIDVNGKWNLETALRNIEQVEKFNPEYVEQPVNSIEDFFELKKHSPVKIAADESIRNLVSAKAFINKQVVDVIIIKPMLVGGLIPALEMIEMAEENNITPVVTSSFESAIGKTSAVIAAAFVKADIAHGIIDSGFYEQDISEDKFPVVSGTISL